MTGKKKTTKIVAKKKVTKNVAKKKMVEKSSRDVAKTVEKSAEKQETASLRNLPSASQRIQTAEGWKRSMLEKRREN